LSWTIDDRKLNKTVFRSMPRNVQVKWTLWVEVVLSEGPDALNNYTGFKDEGLTGEWKGCRSSRLSGGYRVIYERTDEALVVKVERVSNHDYKKRS
jgi:addiction module RelE/StbE family toxin